MQCLKGFLIHSSCITIKVVLFLEKRINVNREKVMLTITIYFLNSAKVKTLQKEIAILLKWCVLFQATWFKSIVRILTQVPENFMKAFNADDVTLTF